MPRYPGTEAVIRVSRSSAGAESSEGEQGGKDEGEDE